MLESAVCPAAFAFGIEEDFYHFAILTHRDMPVALTHVVWVFARSEDSGAFLVENALFDQLVDAITGLEGGVKLYEWVGTKQAVVEAAPNLILEAGVLYPNEASSTRRLSSSNRSKSVP